MSLTLGEWFWSSFDYMKEPICRTKVRSDREEKICDECFDAGFEKGREFERQDIIRILSKKNDSQ